MNTNIYDNFIKTCKNHLSNLYNVSNRNTNGNKYPEQIKKCQYCLKLGCGDHVQVIYPEIGTDKSKHYKLHPKLLSWIFSKDICIDCLNKLHS